MKCKTKVIVMMKRWKFFQFHSSEQNSGRCIVIPRNFPSQRLEFPIFYRKKLKTKQLCTWKQNENYIPAYTNRVGTKTLIGRYWLRKINSSFEKNTMCFLKLSQGPSVKIHQLWMIRPFKRHWTLEFWIFVRTVCRKDFKELNEGHLWTIPEKILFGPCALDAWCLWILDNTS